MRLNSHRLSVVGRRQQGFTILELMIASAVFTIILLVVAIGVVSFTNSYYKGVTSTKAQAVSRSIMAALTQSIQFGKNVSTMSGPGGAQGLCIDNTLYMYQVGQEVVDSSPQAAIHQGYHGLVVTTGGDCTGVVPALPTAPTLPAGQRELLGQHMRLGALDVIQSGSLYTVHVRIIGGEDDLLTPTPGPTPDWANEACAGSRTGSQFCAVSDLTTTVGRRIT